MSSCGKRTEIYSRVVGYHRPVANWNRGKQEEFKERLAYQVRPEAAPTARPPVPTR